ncbi:unnamed protein product [Didymodactylos carnosus]|uniref:Pentraxin (PTX) domain-containing protein n=1 Tax=Didymodactylos carnosus TaxID=1234261 RepID=A0A816AQA0_9BILA|nr:unnamed protein product [Didymodactylos carnosus]CAF1598682.1 unnamed protein product [Didymodactylos carnosus]CAF4313849.1 unnamed protein product [Didymodactylos carnosus]CAF4474693.1 unnamed protein product [Didymodactylos carnosus]
MGQMIAQIYSASSTVISVMGPQIQLTPFWTHIAQTWSSTNGLRLYINGYLYTSVTATTSTAGSAQNYVTLGTVLSGSGCSTGSISISQYYGAIDDFRIYSRELTATEICQLANP